MKFLELLGIQEKNFDNDTDLERAIREGYAASWKQNFSNWEEVEEQVKKINLIYSHLLMPEFRRFYHRHFPQIDSKFDFTKDSVSEIEKKIIQLKKMIDEGAEVALALNSYNKVLISCPLSQSGLMSLRSILAKKTGDWNILSSKAQEIYASLLKEREAYMSLILNRAQEILEQQNFHYSQKNLLRQRLVELHNEDYTNLPPELFKNMEEEKVNLSSTYIKLLEERVTLFINIHRAAIEALKQQKFVCKQQSLTLLNNILQQIKEQNYNSIPSNLLSSVGDVTQREYLIYAYYEVLERRKNLLENLYYTVWQALDQENIPCSKQGIAILAKKLSNIEIRNYSALPQSILKLFNKMSPFVILDAYSDLLLRKKSYIESNIQGVQEILKNILENKSIEQKIDCLNDIAHQINQGIYNSLLQKLEPLLEESVKTDLISVYSELINEYIGYYDSIWNHAKNIIQQQDFQCNEQTLNCIIETIKKNTQMDYSSLPQNLLSGIHEDYYQDIILAYSELLQKTKISIESNLNDMEIFTAPLNIENQDDYINIDEDERTFSLIF